MFKMTETNNIYPDLSATPLNDQQFRLKTIKEIKDYFVVEIKKRELMNKRLSKYIASFDYFYKSLIVLSSHQLPWSTNRNCKCEFQSCTFNFYNNHKKAIKNNKK